MLGDSRSVAKLLLPAGARVLDVEQITVEQPPRDTGTVLGVIQRDPVNYYWCGAGRRCCVAGGRRRMLLLRLWGAALLGWCTELALPGACRQQCTQCVHLCKAVSARRLPTPDCPPLQL